MSTRDQLRFIEIFEDHSLIQRDAKRHVKISKREPNPELSLVGNFALDFVDFKDRVRVVAKDLTLQDLAQRHQRLSAREVRDNYADLLAADRSEELASDPQEGYSSLEAPSEEAHQEEIPQQEEASAEEDAAQRKEQ